jgi:cyanophycinase-like exopeptidase
MDKAQQREAVRDAAVDLVMETRGEFLASGASPLSHWDQLHDRLLVAMRSSESIETLVTAWRRGLRLGVPSLGCSASAERLMSAADADAQEMIEMLEAEIGLVMARARLEADRRKQQKENR